MLADRLDDHVLLMTILNNMAEQDLRLGDLGHRRRRTSATPMRLSTELGVPVMTAFALVAGRSRMAQPAGDDAAAVRLHAAADALLEACRFELIPDDRVLSEAVLATARDHLGAAYDDHADAGPDDGRGRRPRPRPRRCSRP